MIVDAEKKVGALQASEHDPASRASAASCERAQWMNSRNSGTSSAAT
jgi:hypothetical protein